MQAPCLQVLRDRLYPTASSVFHLARKHAGTKGWEQGGDVLLFIATVPTHGCQESERGAPQRPLG